MLQPANDNPKPPAPAPFLVPIVGYVVDDVVTFTRSDLMSGAPWPNDPREA